MSKPSESYIGFCLTLMTEVGYTIKTSGMFQILVSIWFHKDHYQIHSGSERASKINPFLIDSEDLQEN